MMDVCNCPTPHPNGCPYMDYPAQARRMNAFLYGYADKLEKKAKRTKNEERREKLREKAISVRCLTIPMFGGRI